MKRKRTVRETIESLVSVERPSKRPVEMERRCPHCAGDLTTTAKKEVVCGGKWVKTWLPDEGKYLMSFEESCGFLENTVASDPSYKMQYTYYTTTYSPMNHLLETFKRMEGTEQTEIPRNLLEAIRAELRRRYVSQEDITTEWVLMIMGFLTRYRNMDCRSYYENVEKIRAQLTGVYKHIFREEQKEAIKTMFRQFVHEFTRMPESEKNGRCSLPEYSYLIYMFSTIRGYYNILKHLSLVQGNTVLNEYNRLFKLGARRCNWPLYQLSLSSIHRIS